MGSNRWLPNGEENRVQPTLPGHVNSRKGVHMRSHRQELASLTQCADPALGPTTLP